MASRSRITHFGLLISLILSPVRVAVADLDFDEGKDGLLGRAEFYLPGDPDEPVQLYFAAFPSQLTNPDFDPEEYRRTVLQAYEAFARTHAESDPERLKKTTVQKLFGKSIYETDWEIRMENAKRVQGTAAEGLIDLEPHPEQRLDKFKMFFTEFAVQEDQYDPIVQRNLARLKVALLEGREDFLYEKLTFPEKLKATGQFIKDISAGPTNEAARKEYKKVLGVTVHKRELLDGIVFGVYSGVVRGSVWMGKLPDNAPMALGLTAFQTLLTFSHATFLRQYAAAFNVNPTFPGFKYNHKLVKLRRDAYYLLTSEIIQAGASQGDWSAFADAQRVVLFQNRVMGKVDAVWGSGPRDEILRGERKPTRMFNRMSFALTTPFQTMETAQLFVGTHLDIHLGHLLLYKVTPSTVANIASYYGLSQLLKYRPQIFTDLSERVERWETKQIQKIGEVWRLFSNQCRSLLGLPPRVKLPPLPPKS